MRTLLPIARIASLSFLLGFGAVRWQAAKKSEKTPPSLPSPASSKEMLEPSPSATAASSTERIESALALGKKLQGVEQEYEFYTKLKQLDVRELAACADKFAELVQTSRSATLCEVWLDRWLEVDSLVALRWLESTEFLDKSYTPQNGPSLLSILGGPQSVAFKVLARRQPEWTRQYLNGIESGAKRDVAVYQLIGEVARQDAAKAKELLDGFNSDTNRGAAVQGFVAGLAASDVRAAFATALAEAPGPLRNELLQTTFGEAAKHGVGTVSELLDRIQDPVLRRKLAAEAALGLAWHSRENPLPWLMEEAKRKVSFDTNKGNYDTWSNYVGQALMTDNHDPVAAINWAANVENDPEQKLFTRMLGDWSRSDPEETRRWLTEHPTALEEKNLNKVSSIIAVMARNDAVATSAWAESLPPGPLRDQARFQAALGSGSEGSFAQAVAAYHSIASGDTKGDLAKQLTTVLVKLDATATARWALQMEQGPARSTVIATVSEQWSQNDPKAVASWIETLPSGSDRDRVIGGYAAKVAYADPAMATEWVLEVDDPKVRADAAKQVFRVWSWENPVASRAWLQSLPGVDEKWRADVLQKAK